MVIPWYKCIMPHQHQLARARACVYVRVCVCVCVSAWCMRRQGDAVNQTHKSSDAEWKESKEAGKPWCPLVASLHLSALSTLIGSAHRLRMT
jgi:hypothetical protein